MAHTYCTATSWGKDFFTHEDRNDFYLSGHHGNVWVVGANAAGISWINRVSGTAKVKAEAQAIVDAAIETQQAAWDDSPAEEQARTDRPVKYILPQELIMANYKGIKGYKVQSRASDPTANEGQVWYNTASSTLKYDTVGAGAWAAGGTVPASYYGGALCGTQDSAILAGGVPGATNTSWTYNGTAWTSAPTIGTARSNMNSGGTGTGTAGLIFGGEIPGSPYFSGDTEEWNGTGWSEKGDLTNDRMAMAGAGTSTASLCIQGAYPAGTNLVESWNGTSWTAGTATPLNRYAVMGGGTTTSALVCGGKINTATSYDTSDEWNGTSWTSTPTMNTGRRYGSRGATSGTSALIFGGEAPPPVTKKTELWNGTSWTELADMSVLTQKNAGNGTATLALSVGNESPNNGASEEWSGAPAVVKTVTVS